jgi:hypothetical protein
MSENQKLNGPRSDSCFFLFFLHPLILRWLAAVLPQLDRHFTAFFLFFRSLPSTDATIREVNRDSGRGLICDSALPLK